MNLSVVAGTLSVAALAAIFYFGQPQSAPPVKVETAAPTAKIHTATPAGVETHVVKKLPEWRESGATYHRVLPDGSKGEAIGCKEIRQFIEGKSTAELEALAKQRGVTQAVLATYHVCVQ